MTERYLNDLTKRMFLESSVIPMFMDYPRKHAEWPNSKVEKYEKNIIRMFHDPSYSDYVDAFELRPKSGEVYVAE